MLHSKKAIEEAFHHDGHHDDDHGEVTPGPKGLDERTLGMLTSALNLHKQTVGNIVTHPADLFTVYMDTVLNKETRKNILKSGFSRIPVYLSETHRIFVGVLITKRLVTVQPGKETLAELFATRKIALKIPLFVHKDAKIKNVADKFRKGYTHLAIVCSDVEGPRELLKKCEDLQKEVNDL